MRKPVSVHIQGVLLMLSVRKRCPVDYRLCNQTVTIYHKDGDTFSRKTVTAFLDYKKTQNVDKTGSKEANSFLLVAPGSEQACFVGDKVYLGDGPEIATAEAWRAFIPANVPGLCVVQYVDTKYWHGQIVHTEAGG